MKRIFNTSLIVLLTVAFCAATSFAGNSMKPNNETYIKVGTKLVYAINKNGEKYNVTVTITSLSPTISFDWKESAPRTSKGSITMTADAIDHASGIITGSMGGALNLDKETAIWLSKSLMSQITGEGRLVMTVDGKEMPCKTVHFNEPPTTVIINGKPTPEATQMVHNGYMEPATKRTITYLDSTDFPILVKLDFGWTMTLTSISN